MTKLSKETQKEDKCDLWQGGMGDTFPSQVAKKMIQHELCASVRSANSGVSDSEARWWGKVMSPTNNKLVEIAKNMGRFLFIIYN